MHLLVLVMQGSVIQPRWGHDSTKKNICQRARVPLKEKGRKTWAVPFWVRCLSEETIVSIVFRQATYSINFQMCMFMLTKLIIYLARSWNKYHSTFTPSSPWESGATTQMRNETRGLYGSVVCSRKSASGGWGCESQASQQISDMFVFVAAVSYSTSSSWVGSLWFLQDIFTGCVLGIQNGSRRQGMIHNKLLP